MIADIRAQSVPRHLTRAELEAGLPNITAVPCDSGRLEMIVARPHEGRRQSLEQAELSPGEGLAGDRWLATSWLRLADGAPDPAVQITLMNARCIEHIAGSRDWWFLAGDNLYVDFDLSTQNLPEGSRLKIGECILEISQPPHNGCGKFKQRFGEAALKFVNSPEGKAWRLRGVHARVVQAGLVAIGDSIEKIAIPAAADRE